MFYSFICIHLLQVNNVDFSILICIMFNFKILQSKIFTNNNIVYINTRKLFSEVLRCKPLFSARSRSPLNSVENPGSISIGQACYYIISPVAETRSCSKVHQCFHPLSQNERDFSQKLVSLNSAR